MSSAIAIPPHAPATAPRRALDFTEPVPRPGKSIVKLIGEVLDHGGPG